MTAPTTTTNATGGTAADLLAELQAAWDRRGCVVTRSAEPAAIETPPPRRVAEAATPAARIVSGDHPRRPTDGARVCLSHQQPFDAVETADPRRVGWIRFTCRRCGGFLGYSPADCRRTLNDHG